MNVKVFQRVSAIVAGVAVTLAMASCGGEKQQQQAPAPQIATLTLSPSDATEESVYPASIKGKTDIDIRPQVTGFITKVHVDEGQHVRKGQTLFTLDQVQYQAAVDNAIAAVNSAKTRVKTARLPVAVKARWHLPRRPSLSPPSLTIQTCTPTSPSPRRTS